MDGKVQKALKDAQEELERLTEDPEMEDVYYQRIKDLRDMLSYADAAKEEGLEQGEKNTKKNIILVLHKKQMPIEEICSIVNLSKEQVEEIIQENMKNSK